MNLKLKSILVAVLVFGTSVGGFAQLTGGVQRTTETGDFTYQKNKKAKAPGGMARSNGYNRGPRPDHLNNALLKYFPPIFSQDQGSCDAASYIGYQWTYEHNNYHGLDGSKDENRFTSHFNYLIAHNGQGTTKANLLQKVGNPSVADYGGQTYSKWFGNQTCKDTDYGWMTGYDKWYRTLKNRDWTATKVEKDVMTEEGREMVKSWLWNHDGDYDFNAGGVAWFGMAALDISTGPIPDTPTNRLCGVVGKKYLGEWGPSYNHAQTIVGYDDRIEFDLDSNGVVGEKDKDEVGAWIIANSWGNNWENHGFIYCPYARSVETNTRKWSWDVVRHYIRKDYEPMRTIKVKLAFSRRSLLLISCSATQDTASNVSQDSISFDHFTYAGDGTKNYSDAPKTPMLGRWIDGLHYEPMEFGYDLTELTQSFDRRKPIKYFFNIYTRANVPEENCGTGKLYNASIIDYELDGTGIEFPFKIENSTITGSGKLYRVSVIVPGEQINTPNNIELADKSITWEAPVNTSLPIKQYYIYCDDAVVDSVASDVLTYTPANPSTKAYSVAAVYNYRNKSVISDQTNGVIIPTDEPTSTDNYVIDMKNTMAIANGLNVSSRLSVTVEYWIKPHELKNYCNRIGGLNSFVTYCSRYGALRGGWNSTYDDATYNYKVEVDKWVHCALVLNKAHSQLYINGALESEDDNSNSSYAPKKINPFSQFFIGQDIDNGLVNAQLDEIRIWDHALTREEIRSNLNCEILNPSSREGLVAYYKGNTIEEDGVLKLRDYARGHHAEFVDLDSVSAVVDNSVFNSSATFTANIHMPTETIYTNTPVKFSAIVPGNATSVKWEVLGDEENAKTTINPYITFSKAGANKITLTATSSTGKTATATKLFNVKELPAPVANFEIAANNLPASEYFNFVNHSSGVGCTYKWSMPGADVEEVYATNAAGRFLEIGTYPVTLTVTNASGTSTCTKEVTAVASAPYVDFTVSPSAILIGDKVFFEDHTLYDPQKWQYEINHTSGKRNYVVHAQNTAFTPQAPGYYNVTLKATNEQGTTGKTQNKVFAVSNADPGNGLSMSGAGERIAIPSPFTSQVRNFTIDTWINAADFNGALTMSTDDGIFKTKSNADGSVTFYCNGKSVSSDPNFVVKNEWHHYAISFGTGNVKFFRDGELFTAPSLRLGLSCPAWAGSLTVSSDTACFKGIMDEFRIWGKTLSQTQLKNICNQPMSEEEVATAVSSNNLKLYYQFNQNSGEVIDATSNGCNATRLGFGPDGDAWTSSLGVFTLDFGGDEASDVSADYLTNYKAPFLNTGKAVSTTNTSNLLELKTGTEDSKWEIMNEIVTEKATTGAHVYKAANGDLQFRTGYYGFADTLKNHVLYQTVTLPAGYYTLTVEAGDGGAFAADSSYVFVTTGDDIIDMNNVEEKADAYTSLSNQTVKFTVGEETEVTIGLIINLTGWTAIDVKSFTLMRTPVSVVEPDEETSVYDAVESGSMPRYTPMANAIRVINPTLSPMKVYTLDGKLVFNEMVEGVHVIPFAPGIYVVDGQKIQVK